MIDLVALKLADLVGKKASRPTAIALVVLTVVVLFLLLKSCYDDGVVEDHVSGANAEQLGKKDEATGKADVASDVRQEEHELRVKTTGELVDEAIEKGCAVGEYLYSNGTNCV